MGLFGFVASGGGSIGVLLGGILTSALNWHWIFLVNVPIGVAVVTLAIRLLPGQHRTAARVRLDIAGAVTATASLMLAVYAIVNGNQGGSGQTLGGLGAAIALLATFIVIESRVRHPLVPLELFRRRNLATANVIGVLWAAAMFAWFFLSAQYLQLVLGYSALQVGLAFLPANLIMGTMSVGASARLVIRFGIRTPLAVGLGLAAIGLLLFSRAPVGGSFVADVLPAIVLLGFGAGIAFNPVLLAAMSDVASEQSGLASGVVNTAFMMGGALGLAVLVSLAAARTASLHAVTSPLSALVGGYHVAFLAGAACAAGAAAIGAGLLRFHSSAAIDAEHVDREREAA
jgi:predicted MFS family arabinose efflux permease